MKRLPQAVVSLAMVSFVTVQTSGQRPESNDPVEKTEAAPRQLALLGARFAFGQQGKLREVDLAGVIGFTDAGLVHVRHLTNLRHLNLDETRVTGAGLQHLEGLTSLQTLRLGNTQVTDAGLEHLEGLTSLHHLRLSSTRVTDRGLEHLSGLTSLQTLWLNGTNVTDRGLGHLKELASLQALYLFDTQVSDVGLRHVERLTSLQGLHINRTRVTDAGLQHLKGLTGLRSLGLDGTRVGDGGLEHLKGLASLQKLYLGNTRVSDAGLDHLAELRKLDSLNLACPQVTDRGLEHLSGLTNLQRLWLNDTQVSDAGLERLKELTELLELHLNGTQVTDESLGHLRGLTKLRLLSLRRTRVTEAGLADLRTALPKLTIDHTPLVKMVDRYAVPRGGVAELLKFIEDLKQFRPQTDSQSAEHKRRAPRALSAAAKRILGLEKDEWSKAYQIALRVLLEDRIRTTKGANRMQQQQTLGYVKTFLTAKAEKGLEPQDVILAMSTAWALESSGNRQLAADAYSGFAELVAQSKNERLSHMVQLLEGPARQLALLGARFTFDEQGKVREVNLAGVAGFADSGLVHIGRLTHLRQLNLDETRVTGAGLQHLSGLIGLQTLRLGDTQVTDAGLVHLKELTTLQGLRFINTSITDTGVERLQALTNLQWLDLHNTGVTDAGLEHLERLTNLQHLWLGSTRVTNAGLEHLKGLTNLRQLGLEQSQVADAGLKHIKGLTSLQRLRLGGTWVTDAGLEHLKGLTSLQELYVDDTRVTDTGLEHLKRLTNLQTLSLTYTGVSDAGVKNLQKALPKVDVLYEPLAPPLVYGKAPSLSLQPLFGETIRLSDFRGKVVILNFWATWAPSCVKEMAALQQLAERHEEDLVVLGISVDRAGADALNAYLDKTQITYPVIISSPQILDAFEEAVGEPLDTIPMVIIVDKLGFLKEMRVGIQGRAALEQAYTSAAGPPR